MKSLKYYSYLRGLKIHALLTSFICIMTTILYGQEIKVSAAPTINAGIHYQFVAGGHAQNLKAGFTTSFDYLFLQDKKINFGLGLTYHFSQVEFVPNLNNEDMILHTENVSLISFSFKSIYKFKNLIYLSLVPSVDFQLKYESQQTLDKQTGLGLSIGLGKNIKIKESVYLNLEPRLWIHNIIPFTEMKNSYHLTTLGLNVGLVFGPKLTDTQKVN